MSFKKSYKSGKRFIGAEDLQGSIFVCLDTEGNTNLSEMCEILCYDVTGENFDSIKRYMTGKCQMLHLSSLKRLFRTYNVSEDRRSSILKNVSKIRVGHNGSEIKVDGLPIDLCSPEWGFILGMLPDLKVRVCEGTFKDRELAGELVQCFNNVGLSPHIAESKDGLRVLGKSICGRIAQESGFGTAERQVTHNIHFPDWVYEADNKDFHQALIAGIMESEGSAPTKSTRLCRITQATELNKFNFLEKGIERETTPTNHKVERVYFNNLDDRNTKAVKGSPPPLLMSVKKLLEMYNISSKLTPESVYRTERTTAALWNLTISGEDIRNLYEFCGGYLVSKDEQFERYFEQKQEDHRDKGTRFESYMADVKELYEENGYVTSKMLAEHANRAEKTAVNTLSILKNRGLIECDGFENQYKCWKPV